MPKKYLTKEKIPAKIAKELSEYNNVTSQLLYNRGINSKKNAENFLNPNFNDHLHDPFLLPDMDKAVKRILKAIKKGEAIVFWTDYDADGIPGGALLHDFFLSIGFLNFTNYIPDRHTEGYGLNAKQIEELAKNGCKLLITVDCGTRDLSQIELANSLGIDCIVTDHHEQGEKLPEAIAVVNPKRKDSKYPEQVLCGSGVVWKLIEAILKTKRDLLKEGQEKWLLDLVGIATLSDMVPLTGENRVLSHFGLSVLKKNRRLGLRKLFWNLRIKPEQLTEDDIAFLVTPRINAASRMGHPKSAFDLLISKNEIEADSSIQYLDQINNERKGVVAGIVKEAKKRIQEKIENEGDKKVIVLGNPNWRPALLGLAANSLVEEFNRPVFLWGREGGEFIKGSCRSDGVADLVVIMEKSKDIFLEFGGHKQSGGFSVSHEKIHLLEDILTAACNDLVHGEQSEYADMELKLNDIDDDFIASISSLAPFGVGNEKPIFIFRDIIPEKINRFGKAQEHLSINLRDGSKTLRAISFFTSPDQFGDNLNEGIKTNLVANVEKSFFTGASEIRLRIVDFFK